MAEKRGTLGDSQGPLKSPRVLGLIVSVDQALTGMEKDMMPNDPIYARYANTRGPRVNDPAFDRYLRGEFRGGMTPEELLPLTPGARVRAAVVRLIKTALFEHDRLKPVPAPAGP